MITAKEARELAEDQMSGKTKSELENAEKCIKQAVQSGETECWCYSSMGKRAKEYLESLGYSVKNSFNMQDGDVCYIKWLFLKTYEVIYFLGGDFDRN